MLLATFASAFSPAITTSWPSDATTVRVLAGPVGPRVVSAGAAIEVRDGQGTLEARSDLVAAALGVTDLYDDGTVELLACTPDGLVALAWTESGLGSPLTIETTLCTALAEVEGGFLVGGDPSRAWTVDGVRSDLPLTVGTGGTILSADGTVWAATPGTTTITAWDGVGLTSIEATGALGGLAEAAGVVYWTVRDPGELTTVDSTTTVLADPAGLAAADADLSGVEDLVLLHPARGSIGFLLHDTTSEVELGGLGAPIALAVGAVDEDCPSFFIADGALVTRADITDCSAGTDADGDDWSTADGDCNDADAAVFPGAWEACNAVDDDCDGTADELGTLTVAAGDEDAAEGGTTTFSVTYDGCETPTVTFLASGTREDDCTAGTDTLTCAWADDGDVTVTADATSSTGAAQGVTSLTIANVDPSAAAPECGSSTWTAYVGDHVTRTIDVEDVEQDDVSCYVVSGPPGLRVDADCTVDWEVTEADVGEWNVQLLLTDEDGGRALEDQHVSVISDGCGGSTTGSGCGRDDLDEDRPDGCGCATPGAPPLLLALLFGGILRRRR